MKTGLEQCIDDMRAWRAIAMEYRAALERIALSDGINHSNYDNEWLAEYERIQNLAQVALDKEYDIFVPTKTRK